MKKITARECVLKSLNNPVKEYQKALEYVFNEINKRASDGYFFVDIEFSDGCGVVINDNYVFEYLEELGFKASVETLKDVPEGPFLVVKGMRVDWSLKHINEDEVVKTKKEEVASSSSSSSSYVFDVASTITTLGGSGGIF